MKTDKLTAEICKAFEVLPPAEIQHLPLRFGPERIRVFPPPWKSDPIDDDMMRALLAAFADGDVA